MMIQKLIRYSFVFTLLASIVACSGTREVASDSAIQKRKYRKGLHVNFNKVNKWNKQILAHNNSEAKLHGSSLKEERNELKTSISAGSEQVHKKRFNRRDLINKLAKLYNVSKEKEEQPQEARTDTLDYYDPGAIQRRHPGATTSFIAGLSGITLYAILSNIAGLFEEPEGLILTLAALAIYIVAGIVAFTSAISAKKDIKRDPDKWKGTGLANAGLVFGISILGSLLIALTLLMIFIALILLTPGI